MPSLAPSTSCLRCNADLPAAERFCAACGADREVEAQVTMLEATTLATARKWIFGIGVWYVVSALLEIAVLGPLLTPTGKELVLGIGAGLFGIHALLYVWAKRQAFPAAIVAFVLFVSVQLLAAVSDPTTAYKGLLIKILFVVALVKAMQAGYEVKRLRGSRA